MMSDIYILSGWFCMTFPWHDGCGSQDETWNSSESRVTLILVPNKFSPNAVSCSTELRHGVEAGVGEFWNWPHEVDSKSPNLLPQLWSQLQKFPNWEVGNLKLRHLVTGVEARVVPQVGLSLACLKHPNVLRGCYIKYKQLATGPDVGRQWMKVRKLK